MKSVLFIFVLVFLGKASSAQSVDSSHPSQLTESQLFMKASCEGLAEFASPLEKDQETDDTFVVESVSLITTSPDQMVFRLSFALADDKRATVQKIVEYNCFQCRNRIHEPFVFTTEVEREVACKEDQQ